ncbi:uncharacterized protein [Argopecten irradians]|uniref:uncharacterized protein n=1 Tax=Argopecten irradians TaxID=31199 RepID=UPI00371486E0
MSGTNVLKVLLGLVVMLSLSRDRVCGLRHRCGSVPDIFVSDDETGGYKITVRHQSLDPLLDLIPNVTYTVEIHQEFFDRKIHALEIKISHDAHNDKNKSEETGRDVFGMHCGNFRTPVRLQWIPRTSPLDCVRLRAIIFENDTKAYNISLELCKPKGCRQYYNADNKGMVFSPGFPENYIDNYNCTYVIYSRSQHLVHLQFRSFELEPSYEDRCFDSILIQTDNSSSVLCGTRNSSGLNELNFSSNDGVLFLTLVTDYKVVAQGFRAFYYTIDTSNGGCSYTTSNVTGQIHSPNYPDKYYPMTTCVVRIILPTRFRVTLHLQHLDLDNSNRSGDCSTGDDFVMIQNDMEDEPKSFYLCGSMLGYSPERTMIQSSGSEVTVTFRSYSIHEGSGFMIRYTALESCRNVTYQNKTYGIFNSVNFPDKYLNNQNCFTSINLTESSKILEVRFNYLYTVSHENNACMKQGSCKDDYVEIHSDDVITRLCGYCTRGRVPVIFYSASGFVMIRFVTDNHQTQTGYSGQWRLVDRIPRDDLPCSTLSIATDELTYDVKWEKKSWPDADMDCKNGGGFLVSVSSIFIQQLLEKFIIENSNCSHHATSFWIGASDRRFEGDFFWADLTRMKFTNWFEGWAHYNFSIRQPSDDGLSDEDCVEMRNAFPLPVKGIKHTDSYYWNDRNCLVENPYICQTPNNGVTFPTGWNSLVTRGVQDLTIDSQERIFINSLHFPGNYEHFTDTTHRISSSNPFHRLQIRFEAFDLEQTESCLCDNITLSSFSDASPDVTRCGNWNKKIKLMDWTSRSNRANIRFQTDNSVSGSGFRLSVIAREDPVCMEAFRDVYTILVVDPNIMLLSDDRWCFLIVKRATESYTSAKELCTSYNASLHRDTSKGHCAIYNKAIQSIYSDYSQEYISIWEETKSNDTRCTVKNVGLSGQRCTDNLVTQSDCDIPHPFICVRRHHRTDMNLTRKEVLQSPVGQLQWPERPSLIYGNNIHNTYEIQSTEGQRIFVSLEYLDIEYQEMCLYDYLRFSEIMNNNVTLCGNKSTIDQQQFLSVRQRITITFHTDSTIGYRGFQLSWKWINDDECIEKEDNNKTNSGSLSSINYPLGYPDVVHCCRTFRFPGKNRVILVFVNISIISNYSNAALVLHTNNQELVLPSLLNQTATSISQRTFIAFRNRFKLCLRTDSIEKNDGFYAEYTRPSDNIVRVSESKIIPTNPENGRVIQSLHFPNTAPLNSQQTIHLSTETGYNIRLEFTNISIGNPQTYLEILDTSLGPGHYRIIRNVTANSGSKGHVIIQSHLNSLQLTFSTGLKSENLNLFQAQYAVCKDDQYIEKTKYIKGGKMNHCEAGTCLNGGVCVSSEGNMYTCQCMVNTTGLFCQTFLCDLHPCVHGECVIADGSVTCVCESERWGEYCNMTTVQCNLYQCQGHGVCAGSIDNPICICTEQWIGESCSVKKPLPRVVTTTGEKLLNEPIWIGMIVVLNLIFAFTSMFIVRRRCEKKLKCCKESKAAENGQEKSSGRGGVHDNNYPCLGDMYKHYRYQDSDHDLSPEEKQAEEEDCKEIESPDINFGNHMAAAKLFASYNQGQTDFSAPVLEKCPSILEKDSEDSVGGMKGGTLNFCTTYDMDMPVGEYHENEIAEACFDAAVPILKISELGMASLETDYLKSFKTRSPQVIHRRPDISQHCYPEIVVLDSTPPHLIDSPGLRRAGSRRFLEKATEYSNQKQAYIPFSRLDVSEKRKRFASKLRVERSPFITDSLNVHSSNSTANSSTDPRNSRVASHHSEPGGLECDRLGSITHDNKRREQSICSREDMYGSVTSQSQPSKIVIEHQRKQNDISSMTEKSSIEGLSCNAFINSASMDRKLRRLKRRKKRNSHEICSANTQNTQIMKTSSDSNLPHFSKAKLKQKHSRKKHKNDKCQSIQRMLESSMTEDTLSTSSSKNLIRKSRSNDLVPNEMSRSPCRVRNNSDTLVLYGSSLQRRHSYHTRQKDGNLYDPDSMLNTDQSLSYRLEKSANDLPRLPSFSSYKVLVESTGSSDVSGMFSTKTNTNTGAMLKVPLTSDTDTGFSSSTRSLRSPRGCKEETDPCIQSMTRTHQIDSAYQTKQNSDDVSHRTARNQDSQTTQSRKDSNVMVRLQHAANRLQTLSSSGDSAVNTTISEDDVDDRTTKKLSEYAKQGEWLTEVTEEHCITSNTFNSLTNDLDLAEPVCEMELHDFTCV